MPLSVLHLLKIVAFSISVLNASRFGEKKQTMNHEDALVYS